MYRHLLVPIDNSALAVDTVRKAVELARGLAARVTFFHAQEDYAASSVGALQRVIAPTAFNEGVAGEARAILSKAEVVAREAGIAFDSMWTISNRPAEAILDAAEARGCDLIFMASHGRRGIKGLVLGSQTQRVLQHASVAVLVAANETNLPAGALISSLAIIGDEHRSLAAVIHGLDFLVRETRETGRAPSFALLHAMLYYIENFAERLHHPKEESYVFRKLRERTSECDETLDELERQHAQGHALVEELGAAIDAYESDPSTKFEAFASTAERFATHQMAHMRLETKVILPAARKHFTAQDWAEIDRAFAANGDPRFSVDNDEEFRALFARILNLAPTALVGGEAD